MAEDCGETLITHHNPTHERTATVINFVVTLYLVMYRWQSLHACMLALLRDASMAPKFPITIIARRVSEVERHGFLIQRGDFDGMWMLRWSDLRLC